MPKTAKLESCCDCGDFYRDKLTNKPKCARLLQELTNAGFSFHPDCPLPDHREIIIERFGVVEEEIPLMDFIDWLPKDDSFFMHTGSSLMDVIGKPKKPKLLIKFYVKEK